MHYCLFAARQRLARRIVISVTGNKLAFATNLFHMTTLCVYCFGSGLDSLAPEVQGCAATQGGLVGDQSWAISLGRTSGGYEVGLLQPSLTTPHKIEHVYAILCNTIIIWRHLRAT